MPCCSWPCCVAGSSWFEAPLSWSWRVSSSSRAFVSRLATCSLENTSEERPLISVTTWPLRTPFMDDDATMTDPLGVVAIVTGHCPVASGAMETFDDMVVCLPPSASMQQHTQKSERCSCEIQRSPTEGGLIVFLFFFGGGEEGVGCACGVCVWCVCVFLLGSKMREGEMRKEKGERRKEGKGKEIKLEQPHVADKQNKSNQSKQTKQNKSNKIIRKKASHL